MNAQTLSELLPKAESGDIKAQEALAFAYIDEDEDNASAVKWLEAAEAQGHLSVRGAWILGVSYDDGRGVPKDAAKAERYYRFAADSDEDNVHVNKACYWLAYGHWAGDIVFGQNDEVAVYYLEKLLRNNTKKLQQEAMVDLALLYSFGDGTMYNPDKADEYIAKAREVVTDKEMLEQVDRAASILASSRISKLAQNLLDQAGNEEKNTRMERAENGDPTAQYLVYSASDGAEEYEHFLFASASSGYLPAQARAAGLLEFRDGKHAEAYDLALKAWSNDEFHNNEMYEPIRPSIGYILGWCLYTGNGAAKDEFKALEYLNVAADSTADSTFVQRARVMCAMIAVNPENPKRDLETAVTRCEQVLYSTDTDNKAVALRLLMAIYNDPTSSVKDVEKAIEFATLASQSDFEDVRKMGTDILSLMTHRKELLDRAAINDADALYALSEDDFFASESDQYLQRAAHAGNGAAQMKMAIKYMLQENEAECFSWCQRAYNNGIRNTLATFKLGHAYGEGTCVGRNPAMAYNYLKECINLPVNGHDIWMDKARAYIMFNCTGNDPLFGENDIEAAQLGELLYCDAESDFRNEALTMLIATFGDINSPAFDMQKAIMYTKMGLDSSYPGAQNAAQQVKKFYHQVAVRESVNRHEAARNGGTYRPSEKEQIALAINQQLVHYSGSGSGGSSGSSSASGGSSSMGSGANAGGSKSGGCYIATAVYGSYDCPEVWTLRRYRDNVLSKTWIGRRFVQAYYATSPWIVKRFGKNHFFKCFWKKTLDKWVHVLNSKGVDDTPYND